MTTTYELYTNENGTPKLVEGKAPAIIERVEALEEKSDDYLPSGGGKLTGAITLNTSTFVNRSGDNSNLQINGGSGWGKGASIELYGKDRATDGGVFKVRVNDGTTYKDLVIKPDGTMTLGGKNIVRSVNGTFADANGDVTLTVGGSSAYQIPFGTCSTSSTISAKVATITNGATFSLAQGSVVAIKFSQDPTNFTSLNVNSSGAKEVRKHLLFGEMEDTFSNGFIAIAPSNLVFVFVFDGTYWNLVSAYGEGEIYGIS